MKTSPARIGLRAAAPVAAPALALVLGLTLALALPAAARAGGPAPAAGEGHAHTHTATAPAPQPQAAGSLDPKAAFERIKKLAGDWRETETTPGGVVTSTSFRVTAAGSAVVETMFPGSDHEMVNVYYLDGPDLVVTHYCSAGNQPRMRFDPAKSGPDLLVFDFAGGSNLDPAKDGHIHATRIALKADDRMESEWISYKDGKDQGSLKVVLSRSR